MFSMAEKEKLVLPASHTFNYRMLQAISKMNVYEVVNT